VRCGDEGKDVGRCKVLIHWRDGLRHSDATLSMTRSGCHRAVTWSVMKEANELKVTQAGISKSRPAVILDSSPRSRITIDVVKAEGCTAARHWKKSG
jgi:hypothetical protein